MDNDPDPMPVPDKYSDYRRESSLFDVWRLAYTVICAISSHGTLVGGLIVASRNSVCGVGVAYDADLGGKMFHSVLVLASHHGNYCSFCFTSGIRLPQHAFTDIVAATALTFQLSKVDIYSNSWALPGNGKSLGGPGRLTNRKLGEAVAEVALQPNRYLYKCVVN